jgi:hypothetical protein
MQPQREFKPREGGPCAGISPLKLFASAPSAHSCGLISFCIFYPEPQMGNKIVTEADRKFTPPLPALPGVNLRTGGRGQRVSLERGVATRSKKNPGKRSKKGG